MRNYKRKIVLSLFLSTFFFLQAAPSHALITITHLVAKKVQQKTSTPEGKAFFKRWLVQMGRFLSPETAINFEGELQDSKKEIKNQQDKSTFMRSNGDIVNRGQQKKGDSKDKPKAQPKAQPKPKRK